MKRFISILSIIFVLFLSITPNYIVYASGEQTESQEVTSDDNIIQKLYNYCMSVSGAFYKSQEGIYNLPETINTNFKNKLAELMNGGGIYVDSDGNYVFTDGASQSLFEAFNNNSSVDARVVSNFNNFTFMADGYVNADYVYGCNALSASLRSTGKDYLLCSYRLNYLGNNGQVAYVYTFTVAYDLSNVAYISFLNRNDGAWIEFFNSSSSSINVPFSYVGCRYSVSGNSYGYKFVSDYSNSYYVVYSYDFPFSSNSYKPLFVKSNYINGFYDSFPIFNNSSGMFNLEYESLFDLSSVNFYCNKSLIIAKNSVGANSILNQTQGVFYESNNFNTVNKTLLENNNWESIYNNYINNVKIDYEQDPSMSSSDLRKIMKKYTGTIIDAIQSGSQNIEDTISISNRYLQAISVDVRNISDKLDNMQSGGGSSDGWTSSQVSQALNLINSIDTNVLDIAGSCDALVDDVGDLNTELVTMNTALNNIYQRLLNMNGGGGGGSPTVTMPTDWDEVLHMLTDVSDGKADQIATVLEVVGDVLKMSVPFCYISVIGGAITALSADPIPPVFDVEFKSEQGNSLNFAVQEQIDLTWIADLRPIWIAMEEIVFIIGLIMFTFTIYTTFGSLFS